jgi:hypothetical protein
MKSEYQAPITAAQLGDEGGRQTAPLIMLVKTPQTSVLERSDCHRVSKSVK